MGLRTDTRLDVSPHRRFDKDQTTVRLRLRVDEQPTMNKPLTPKLGATLSPFVVLEAHA